MTPGSVRCGEHADFGTLTYLLQDEMGGLEVKGVDNIWIQAAPVKDAILVRKHANTHTMSKGSKKLD